jgi:predicted short-subunit dehydrogenase-like oxidoreductase (DUF2520 family)
MNKTFAVIGTGVVGTALAVLLEEAGWECVGVNTRSQTSYARFCQYLAKRHLPLGELIYMADIIFITTLDGEIEKVSGQLTDLTRSNMAEFNQRGSGQFWIHCSGSIRSEVLCKDFSLGINTLSIHPLQAFAGIDSALALMPGTHFGIEGKNQESEALGIELVKILGGIPHKIDPAKKNLYHAGAAVVSNYLVALAYLGVKFFELAGIEQDDALESLLPLITGSCRNIAKAGLPLALTGPIARGDAEVVAKHLQEMPSELRETYKGLGRLALELGRERKQLNGSSYSPDVLERLESLLGEES